MRKYSNDTLVKEQSFDELAHDEQPTRLSELFNSFLLITTITLVFGALSYALIQINNAVFNLSIPESLWCGLAMSLVTAYYLWKRVNPAKQSEAE